MEKVLGKSQDFFLFSTYLTANTKERWYGDVVFVLFALHEPRSNGGIRVLSVHKKGIS